jgi:hypothetical protein
MNADRFDAVIRSLMDARSRRTLLGTALAAVLGTLELGRTEAKKKCPPCKKRKKGKCKKKKPDGTPCPGGTCQGGRCVAPTCSDGKKNGSETDIDCGGSCPRCGAGQKCNSRNDCTTGLCTGATCSQCVLNTDCGLHSNGTQCFCRDTPGGQRICTEEPCRFSPGLTCADCVGNEQCATAGGSNVQCCTPCGAV